MGPFGPDHLAQDIKIRLGPTVECGTVIQLGWSAILLRASLRLPVVDLTACIGRDTPLGQFGEENAVHEIVGESSSAMVGNERLTVLIVSDVLLYREGLSASLSAAKYMEVVGSATGAEAVACAQALHPDAIILDASISSGMTLARGLRRASPGARLIGFGINCDAGGILFCAEAGFAGFVGSEGTAKDLISAVECSMRGELLCSPRVSALLFNRIASLSNNNIAEHGPNLTRRELEIARLIKEGLSNKEIAVDLGIAPATVKNGVHNILNKLSVRRRSAVAARLGG